MPAAGEPLWTDADRALVLAHLAEEAGRCECGHPVAESTATENEHAYVGELETCFACKARDTASAEFDTTGRGSHPTAGVKVRVVHRSGG